MYRVTLKDYTYDEQYQLILTEEQIRLLTYLTNNELDINGFSVQECYKDNYELLS